MSSYKANRKLILDDLRKELVGPAASGKPIDCSTQISFEDKNDLYGTYFQKESNEEILVKGRPLQRYGVGVLYPPKYELLDHQGTSSEADVEDIDSLEDTSLKKSKLSSTSGELETDDYDLSMANSYLPSTLGLSFLVEITQSSKLIIEVPNEHYVRKYPVNGRYTKTKVSLKNSEIENTWWLRSSVSLEAHIDGQELLKDGKINSNSIKLIDNNLNPLSLEIVVISRPHQGNNIQRLITVCLVNRTENSIDRDSDSLFQTYMRVRFERPDNSFGILPYPGPPLRALDEEEKSLALLYRNKKNYAVGHGCAADWSKSDTKKNIEWVSAECLPQTQLPSLTPDVKDKTGKAIVISMESLSNLEPGDLGFQQLERVVEAYEIWINERQSEIADLNNDLKETAQNHLIECQNCADRMRSGISYLASNTDARFAFELTNRTMLLQQVLGGIGVRRPDYDFKQDRITFDTPFKSPTDLDLPKGRGNWRAFQIAFLLMSIESSGELDSIDRSMVELIWFPTGGGKTEAYLGLAAFSTFLRRLRNPKDKGVHVLMRYTLRLLTAQQFQRASRLILAMEYFRSEFKQELGEEEFSIGIWLGGSVTPNSRKAAKTDLKELKNDNRSGSNKFLVTQCPWCGAHMGPIKSEMLPFAQKRQKLFKTQGILGYRNKSKTVILHCPDNKCLFKKKLPIYVIDEDVYEYTPTLVIGTVDKFAMLTWQESARKLFGLDENGDRKFSPPGLIIQDELHLIAGPLGSMFGLYEVLIEELCTDYRDGQKIIPKIVCSTATIRRYQQQVELLYGRKSNGPNKSVTLFPPPGLETSDSFFSQYDRDENNELKLGKMFVGINAPGLGSLQTAQVRTFSALLQAPMVLDKNDRDPWWTLVTFFNSLRELGGALSLFQSDIIEHLKSLADRIGIDDNKQRRFLNSDEVMELTSRLESEEVPAVLEQLGIPLTDEARKAVGVCLASSIIEVGIDVDRLSLMAIVGQPKTTAQYIQVSGRVGRRKDEPGLVITLYSPSKPRDRSHFEKFRSYHEQLYAQVEPTSVTPFSPPALDRALHAVMVAFVRQTGNKAEVKSPEPFPKELLGKIHSIIQERINNLSPNELENYIRVFEARISEWEDGERHSWVAAKDDPDPPLLHRAGDYIPNSWKHISWVTPMSLRNVDSECRLEISLPIKSEDANEN